jgi:hypothetical protein
MILYVKDLKNSTQNLLDIIKSFSKSCRIQKQTPRNKLNEGYERALQVNYKLLKKKLKKTTEDGMISHAHGLVKST